MTTSDKILTFVAIFISCLALTVSIVQTRIMQKQSQAAVWPRLTNGQGFGPDYFNYTISNDGVGPAIIQSIQYTYKDTSFTKMNDLMRYFYKLEKKSGFTRDTFRLNYNYRNLYEGGVLGIGEECMAMDAQNQETVELAYKYLLETDIRVDYCNIYETCWSMQNDDVIEL